MPLRSKRAIECHSINSPQAFDQGVKKFLFMFADMFETYRLEKFQPGLQPRQSNGIQGAALQDNPAFAAHTAAAARSIDMHASQPGGLDY